MLVLIALENAHDLSPFRFQETLLDIGLQYLDTLLSVPGPLVRLSLLFCTLLDIQNDRPISTHYDFF